jgi:sugar phosphate isomerase/epimerase
MIPRRTFLGSAALLAARSGFGASSTRPGAIRLGLCSYSMFKSKPQEVIAACKVLGVRYINIKPEAHLPIDTSTPAQIAEMVKMLDDAGLLLAGTGTTYLQKPDQGEIRKAFEYNKALRSPLIVIGPTVETLPLIEKFVKEYNIKVAIHNHGPSDKHFPTPQSALSAIKGADPRVGLCMDIGHTMRAGVDPVVAAKEAGPRLLDMHTKDVHQVAGKWDSVDCGDGDINLPGLFRQLHKTAYTGTCNLEYELKTADKVPGMAKSIAYMRGILAGIAT